MGGVKGLLEEGVFAVGNYFNPEHDPLIASISGYDKMIDHFIKNAQGKWN